MIIAVLPANSKCFCRNSRIFWTTGLLFTATPFTATECTQNGLTAHFGAATLGFLVTFAHKKHLAGYYL